MPAVNQSLFEEAYLAFQEGRLSNAREILTRLIKSEPGNAQYWLLMSAVVESEKEKFFCLQEVLKLDPQNPVARQGLVMLGRLPAQPDLAVPMSRQRRSWKLPPLETTVPVKRKSKQNPLRILLQVVIAVVFLSAGAFLFFQFNPGGVRNVTVLRSPLITEGPTPTFLPKNTLIYNTPETNAGGPPPLSARLEATYTPTPLYVQTPHPIEAYSIGLRRLAAQDYPSAILYFQQAADLAPGSPDLQYYLGEAYRLSQDNDNARLAYLEALKISDSFAPAYLGLGLLQMNATPPDLETAAGQFKEAMELDPGLIEARLAYAEAAVRLNNARLAEEALEGVDSQAASSARYHYLLGYSHYIQDDLEDAQAELESALQLDITILEVYRLLGDIYFRQEQYPEAIEMLETVILYEPENTDALAWLGQAYYETGNDKKALEVLTEAIDSGIRSAKLLSIRGQLYLEENEVDKAIADLNASLKLDKTIFDTNLALSLAFLEKKQPGNAYMQLSAAEAYYETDAEHASLLYYRAQSLELLDETIAAIRDWKALLALPASSMPSAWRQLANQRLEILSTPTVTPVTPTLTMTRMPTRSPTVTFTRMPSRTPTITFTRAPTLTKTQTITRQPTQTRTVTLTRLPSMKITVSPTVKPTATPTPVSTK